ncbi:hypothetical protein [Foetidibacter luteolus]|uniref:hypothetical protein n=1 Tax=Foetidibacter luteolus TaxID=2608880 RepID=UPI00129BAA08|nr:hypothetical protein [Foetidibacter luteolus]
MKILYFLAMYLLFFSCVKSQLVQPGQANKENIQVARLFGTWASSKIDSALAFETKVEKVFRPLSGFSIFFDKNIRMYVIDIQYGERSFKYKFKSLYIKNEDRLFGVSNGKVKNIGKINLSNLQIIEFNLINKNVYDNYRPAVYKKISDCIIDCSIESFVKYLVIEKFFPLKVDYEHDTVTLSLNKKPCACYGSVSGIYGYSFCQILNFRKHEKDIEISIALENNKARRNSFFKLTIGQKNVLTKIK